MLVFPRQELTREQQVEATARFGAVHGHPVPEFLFGAADPVAVVENDADKLPQEDQQFHVDYSFSTEIPDLAVLHAEVLPPNGGDTMWANAGAAYDALSPRMQEFLDGLTARHDAGDKFWWEMRRTLGEEPSERAREHFQGNSHPVVCAHPVTGRKVLFVNPGYTVAINELSRQREHRRAAHAVRPPQQPGVPLPSPLVRLRRRDLGRAPHRAHGSVRLRAAPPTPRPRRPPAAPRRSRPDARQSRQQTRSSDAASRRAPVVEPELVDLVAQHLDPIGRSGCSAETSAVNSSERQRAVAGDLAALAGDVGLGVLLGRAVAELDAADERDGRRR